MLCKIGHLFVLDKLYVPHIFGIHSIAVVSPAGSSFMSWRNRLGHLLFSKLSQLINKELLGSVSIIKESCCVHCKLSKRTIHFIFFFKSTTTAVPFDLIHSDIWDLILLSSMDGSRYYVIFIDDFTRSLQEKNIFMIKLFTT